MGRTTETWRGTHSRPWGGPELDKVCVLGLSGLPAGRPLGQECECWFCGQGLGQQQGHPEDSLEEATFCSEAITMRAAAAPAWLSWTPTWLIHAAWCQPRLQPCCPWGVCRTSAVTSGVGCTLLPSSPGPRASVGAWRLRRVLPTGACLIPLSLVPRSIEGALYCTGAGSDWGQCSPAEGPSAGLWGRPSRADLSQVP